MKDNDHDMWYMSAEVTIKGECRSFSRQVKARHRRRGVTIPADVEGIGREFLSEVLDGTDVFTYSAVLNGATDYPYRFCSYRLQCNGETVVRSVAVRPVRPDWPVQ